MKIVKFFFVAIFLSAANAGEDVIHLVGPGSSAYKELSAHRLQKKLIETAEKYERYGAVERATHHDMAFPKDLDEYRAMKGFGIIWVTSHSQVEAELPIRNFRIYMENLGTIGLDPVRVFSSEEAHELVAKVLGRYRNDSIYLIPFFTETRGATLVADYAINRVDFVLGKIIADFPFAIEQPIKLSHDVAYPDTETYEAMLKREYPIYQDLIE